MTFTINYSHSWSFQFLRERNERSNYDVPLLNKSSSEHSEANRKCGFLCLRSDKSFFALLSRRIVKICGAAQSSNGRNELHAVR